MRKERISYYFIVMAAIVIVLAGIKFAAAIVVPFLLSVFIAVIAAPLYIWLNSKRIPEWLSLSIVIFIIVMVIASMGILVSNSAQRFSENLDFYEERLHQQFEALIAITQSYGIDLPFEKFASIVDANKIMKFAASALKSVGGILTNSFMILLTVVFMLLESTQLAEKIDEADGEKDTIKHLAKIVQKIQKYMVIKTLISAVTGVLVYLLLLFFKIDFPVLWGILAFLLNYVPNIGSLIAAVPAVLLAVVQVGLFGSVEVAMGYVVINIVIGSVVEPKIMGKGLGLSTLVVFLSLIFWGWLLGPVGMLLSIPLTMMAKIAFAAHEDTKWISIMLGDGVEKRGA